MRPLRVTPALLRAMTACGHQTTRFSRLYANEDVNLANMQAWARSNFPITWGIRAFMLLAHSKGAATADQMIRVSYLLNVEYDRCFGVRRDTYVQYQERAALVFCEWLATQEGQALIKSAQERMAGYGL